LRLIRQTMCATVALRCHSLSHKGAGLVCSRPPVAHCVCTYREPAEHACQADARLQRHAFSRRLHCRERCGRRDLAVTCLNALRRFGGIKNVYCGE
jgi:hypothetical protein